MPYVFASLSGGVDSTTLAAHMLAAGATVVPVFFRYGSKHNRFEEQAAHMVARHFGLELTLIDLTAVFAGCAPQSALMAGSEREIPSGGAGYREPGSLEATVVPGRNAVFAAVLSSLAETRALRTGEQTVVAMGMHAADHALYPDCRPEFVIAIGRALALGTENRVLFHVPFVHLRKGGIVSRGLELAAPFALTRSCYQMREVACGVCGACRERLTAFAEAGCTDPIPYYQPEPRLARRHSIV